MKKEFLKRCLAFVIVLALSFCIVGCGKETISVNKSKKPAKDSEKFQKPDNYAYVVLVTINPQFKLYVASDGKVLAVEPINDDAKSLESKIEFENKNVETVIQNLIVAANDAEFIKVDTIISLGISETADENVDKTAVLNQISVAVNEKITELDIKAQVTTSETQENTTDNKDDSEQKDENKQEDSNKEDNKPENTCKHSNVKIIAVSTGNNIIDSSKLDMCYHAKVCNDCSKQIGLEEHHVSGNKCTACSQANFEFSQVSTINAAGSADMTDAAIINSDGSLDYALMLGVICWNVDNIDFVDEWTIKAHESDVLNALRKRFIITDAQFESLKQQGEYEFMLGTQTYSDGYFYFTDPARGGGEPNYLHNAVGYTDDKNGTFKVYYDYVTFGDNKHVYYYEVTYTYNGASNLVLFDNKQDYDKYHITGWKPVVDSMRVKSIKKVDSISGITNIK